MISSQIDIVYLLKFELFLFYSDLFLCLFIIFFFSLNIFCLFSNDQFGRIDWLRTKLAFAQYLLRSFKWRYIDLVRFHLFFFICIFTPVITTIYFEIKNFHSKIHKTHQRWFSNDLISLFNVFNRVTLFVSTNYRMMNRGKKTTTTHSLLDFLVLFIFHLSLVYVARRRTS